MKRVSAAQAVGSVVVVGGLVLSSYQLVIRPWHLRWGATEAEVQQTLPGDDLVPQPKLNATHAITIRAPAAEIWPWLVQMGQGRGGFYSYDWIENLMGLNIHSADRIIPEFQRLEVGDILSLAPGFGPAVAAIEPGRALVLHGDTRTGSTAAPVMKPGDYLNVSWVFFLNQADEGITRLIERFRLDYNPSLQTTLFDRIILEPGSFLMERKMLLGIKERVEAAPRQQGKQ